MKIREGFVSNSSSSSFLIYGVAVEAHKNREPGFSEKLRAVGLKYIYGNPNSDDEDYIGLSWDEIKDDETGKQFKERIEAAVKEVLGDEARCSALSDAWYDG